MSGIVVDYECIWRPTFYLAISVAIFLGSVIFTLLCLCIIRMPKLSQVLGGNRRPIKLGKNINTSSPSKSPNKSPSKGGLGPDTPRTTTPDITHSPTSLTSTNSFTGPSPPKFKLLGKVQYHSLEENEQV